MNIQTSHSSTDSEKQGRKWLVGGVNSPVRAFRRIGGEPLMLAECRGSRVIDASGSEYVDFIQGWGASILGHNHPAVVQALEQRIRKGTLLGLTHDGEIDLARLMAEAVGTVEQVRFTTSGTEACMVAVRLARGITERPGVVTFQGGYHGHGESVATWSAGIPKPFVEQTHSVPYNDREAFRKLIEKHGEQIACVCVEPVAANMGVIEPDLAFLRELRQMTEQYGILLIFDEVVTGFRLRFGGAQDEFNIRPDLTTFGKIIGGTLPIGAVGGPKENMQQLSPEGLVFHAGTFAGHPLSMAAGVAALTTLKREQPYADLDKRTERLTQGLQAAASKANVAVCINRKGSMFTVFFTQGPVRDEAGAQKSNARRFAAWAKALMNQGILIPPSPHEALFVGAAHTDADIDRFITAAQDAFKGV